MKVLIGDVMRSKVRFFLYFNPFYSRSSLEGDLKTKVFVKNFLAWRAKGGDWKLRDDTVEDSLYS